MQYLSYIRHHDEFSILPALDDHAGNMYLMNYFDDVEGEHPDNIDDNLKKFQEFFGYFSIQLIFIRYS